MFQQEQQLESTHIRTYVPPNVHSCTMFKHSNVTKQNTTKRKKNKKLKILRDTQSPFLKRMLNELKNEATTVTITLSYIHIIKYKNKRKKPAKV